MVGGPWAPDPRAPPNEGPDESRAERPMEADELVVDEEEAAVPPEAACAGSGKAARRKSEMQSGGDRKNRLTSIIDQLMSNRTHEAINTGEGQSETEQTQATTKTRRRTASSVKAERLSPSSGGSSRGSVSPGGGAATPSSAAGTPPVETPPPQPALKQMEQMMTRNYSDFMRSLAAKYNNSNPNDYFHSPRNGFLPDSRFSPFKATSSKEATAVPQYNLYSASFPTTAHPLIDMSSTQALISMVRSASAHSASQLETYLKGAGAVKRAVDPTASTSTAPSTSPLDLSSSCSAKKARTGEARKKGASPRSNRPVTHLPPPPPPPPPRACMSLCIDKPCSDSSDPKEAVARWSVDDVCNFVTSIDNCAEYAPVFREQRIDGSALPLLTEEHLTSALSMKLGPALKLRAALARRLGHCAVCLHCMHCHGPAPKPPTPATTPSPAPTPPTLPASPSEVH